MAKVPVFQLSKDLGNGTVDYDYVATLAQAQLQVQNQGYTIDCAAFIAEDTQSGSLVELKRYTQGSYHYYTSNPGSEVSGWTYDPLPTKAFVVPDTAPNPGGRMVMLAGYYKNLSHFMTADLATNPVPTGYTVYPNTHTGWVQAPTRVEFSVSYNGNGDPNGSGVTVTGGNATGEKVVLGGSEYTMTAADAYVQFGIGNWIAFNKTDPSTSWHIQDITEQSNADVRFRKVTFSGDARIAVVDDDNDAGSTDEGYKYTLSLLDVNEDKVITFDPKIINRGATSPGPTG